VNAVALRSSQSPAILKGFRVRRYERFRFTTATVDQHS
jgi:hypothetical protein